MGTIAGIIVAAGYASRFQSAFKPLATIGGMPALEHAVALLNTAGINDIVIVVGHRWGAMGHKLRHLPARFVINEDYGRGMISSIQAGVENLPGQAEAFFLLPVNIPLVRTKTICALAEAFRKLDADILYPSFLARRGHPPLISRRIADVMGAWEGDGGLGSLLDRYGDRAADVPVADQFIHLDMDTRADLAELRARYLRHEIPTEHEAVALLRLWDVPQPVIAHCHVVARVAVTLAEALNAAGCRLDADLLHAAALLHDCAKTRGDHARIGSELLVDAGFGKTAHVVAQHMDSCFYAGDALEESHILYLADKLIVETNLMSLDERLRLTLRRHRWTARQVAIRRFATAHAIQKHIELRIGSPLDVVLKKIDVRQHGMPPSGTECACQMD